MKIEEVLRILNKRYPFEDAEKWDNIGLLVGSEENYSQKFYVSLEATSEVIEKMEEGSTLIVHHPLILSPLKKIDFNSFQGKIIKLLVEKRMNLIALHTNYDRHYLNEHYVEKILKKKVISREKGLIFCESEYENLVDVVKDVENKQKTKNLTYVGKDKDQIYKMAVCVGSGSSLMHIAKEGGADVLLTGDITYHTAVEAKEIGIALIDITHFNSEKYFGDDLQKDLSFEKIEPINPFKVS